MAFHEDVLLKFLDQNLLGKTTLSHAVAEAQKLGGICAFIDAEHAMDPEYSKSIGVKLDELLISQPDNGEQALKLSNHWFALVRSTLSLLTP